MKFGVLEGMLMIYPEVVTRFNMLNSYQDSLRDMCVIVLVQLGVPEMFYRI
jgi:hypothetical protein